MKTLKCVHGCLLLYSVSPVSYTHLDVYKRQTQGIWGICSAQINLILSDGTEELRKVQASIHERFYKSFLIGDLRMGLDAVREHYDTIEQALGEQSLYDLGTHIA